MDDDNDDDEKPSCSYTFLEGSQTTEASSYVDFEEVVNLSYLTSSAEGQLWIELEKENYDDLDSIFFGVHCSEKKDEEDTYYNDYSQSEDEGEVCKLTYKGTEYGKLTGTFQNQDIPKRESGNNTVRRNDESIACLGKIFSEQEQLEPNRDKESLDAKLNIQNDEKPYKCSRCEKSYFYKNSLKEHQNTHLKEKPYKCSECEKSYSYKRTLRVHQKSHLKERPYKCSESEQSYSYKRTLRQHQKSHLKEKPYKCSECGKSYTFKNSLRIHEKTHLKERPYKCSECGKSYFYKESYRQHEKSCVKKKPYECLKCGKNFVFKTNLNRHQKNHQKEK